MHDDFLFRYLAAFDGIPGWYSPDACLLFMAYHQLLAEEGLAGDTLEIGVHHGLSAIGIAALRGEGRRFVAVDLFEDRQAENVSRSGFGNRARFLANMGRFYDDLSFLTTIAAPSSTLRPGDVGRDFTFCHIDGGHSVEEVYADLELASAISRPGGLIALDDYFNPAFPGVSEAAVRFGLHHADMLRPVAIGFNKVLLQRAPAPFDLNERFRERFPRVQSNSATFWGVRTPAFDAAFGVFFDTAKSTPHALAPSSTSAVAARIEPATASVAARTGDAVVVPVHITNLSRVPFASGAASFGVSYHLWSADQHLLQFDNPRTWFDRPLLPGSARTLDVAVQVPDVPGRYDLEFDIVWEGVLWLKDHGTQTARVALEAVAADGSALHAAAARPVKPPAVAAAAPSTRRQQFLSDYFSLFESIPGWFSPDAYLLVAAYNQLLAEEGFTGDVLEIGVYHGLSAIGFAALRGEDRRFVAVDLFDMPAGEPGDRSLFGDVSRFRQNMARWNDDLSFVTTISARSATLGPRDLNGDFMLCHIDAGHSAPEVLSDLKLCAAVTRPGGLIVLDDFSAPLFPGVAEAALRFSLESPGTLRPIALGFNKAVFQREPAPFDLNRRFAAVFPQICAHTVLLWDVPVPLYDTGLTPFIDAARSTPQQLATAPGQIAARIEPVAASVTGPAGGTLDVPVQVTNLSRMSLSCEQAPFGLSYHLRTAGHALMKYDNPRAYFDDPLAPHHSRIVHVPVRVPDEPGQYELEFDIVWEGVLWLKDARNPTASVFLTAIGDAAGVTPA